MRPFIDLNNLSYSKETSIYYSRSILILWICVLIAGLILAISALQIEKGFIISLILLTFIVFIGKEQFKILKRIKEVQFRINSKGIQYRDQVLVPWSNIENERIVTEGRDRRRRTFFMYSIIDQDKIMKVDTAELNFDAGELQHTLTIHRNRYKRENTIV